MWDEIIYPFTNFICPSKRDPLCGFSIITKFTQYIYYESKCQIEFHIYIGTQFWTLNTLRLRQNGRHFADDIFKRIFVNRNIWTLVKNLVKFVPRDLINNNPALFHIMVWRWPGNKPLSDSMMVSLLMHIYASYGLHELTIQKQIC